MKGLPTMLALRWKLAYYVSIMINASAYLLYIKLCLHNQCRPKTYTTKHFCGFHGFLIKYINLFPSNLIHKASINNFVNVSHRKSHTT